MKNIQLTSHHGHIRMRDPGDYNDILQKAKSVLLSTLAPISEQWISLLFPKTHKQISVLTLIENCKWKILVPYYWYYNWKFQLPAHTPYYNDIFERNKEQVNITEQELTTLLTPVAEKIWRASKLPLENYQCIWAYNNENDISRCFVFKPDTIHIPKSLYALHKNVLTQRTYKRISKEQILIHPYRKKSAIKNVLSDYYNDFF